MRTLAKPAAEGGFLGNCESAGATDTANWPLNLTRLNAQRSKSRHMEFSELRYYSVSLSLGCERETRQAAIIERYGQPLSI